MVYIVSCIPVCGRIKGSDWSITTMQVGSYTPVVTFDLVVIPQWLVVIPQQGNFKAPQSVIKECVNTTIA